MYEAWEIISKQYFQNAMEAEHDNHWPTLRYGRIIVRQKGIHFMGESDLESQKPGIG
jgi:hypothetical protein